MAYSMDLRLRVVEAVKEEGMSQPEAARTFGVAAGTVNAWLKKHKSGNLEADKPGPTGSRTLTDEDLECLRLWVDQRPGITSAEAAAKIGHKVDDSYIRKLWVGMGLSKKKKI